MRKIRLNIDRLQVESFSVTDGQGAVRGTVNGRQGGNLTVACGTDTECNAGTGHTVDASFSAHLPCDCPNVAP